MTGKRGLTCTVVIPCRNEEGFVETVARRIPEMGAGTEIVFVDDGSTDGTAGAIRRAIASFPERRIRCVEGPARGKAAAVQAGFAVGTGDVFIVHDADLTVLPEDLPRFHEAVARRPGSMAIGTRLVENRERGAMPFANLLGNMFFAGLVSVVTGHRITDTLCGTKACCASDYRRIEGVRPRLEGIDRWGDFDWIFCSAHLGLGIVEIPVRYHARRWGKTKMEHRLRETMRFLCLIWLAIRRLRLRRPWRPRLDRPGVSRRWAPQPRKTDVLR
ncbi:MAG: glycosyltransferase family 2 protein [Planctomycetes bacterium]|nr:glycosyltransferase family 2 protein [Planctomycetota bacterium]